jgi:D-sedoheptulose 7-phosphate isomerase
MDYLRELIKRYPVLESTGASIQSAFELLRDAYTAGGKLLIAGNGGSAADSEHITGELMKNFVKKRALPSDFLSALKNTAAGYADYLAGHLQPGLPTVSLTGHPGLASACINDIDGNIVYAQQLYGLGKKEDVFLGISTSGNAKNVFYALLTAKALGMKTIGLTGGTGGLLAENADIAIVIPEKETYKIQELHLPVYHALCLLLEEHFF